MAAKFPPPWAVVGPSTPPPNADLVLAAYAWAGRNGFGTGVSQIDQDGYYYWLGRLNGGMDQQAFAKTFVTVVLGAIKQPTSPVAAYVGGYLAEHPQNLQDVVTLVGVTKASELLS